MDTSNDRYEKMALKYELRARANPAEPAGWVMAKTVRWHQYWLGSPSKRDEAATPLMRLLREPSAAQLQGVEFETDVAELCQDMARPNSSIDGCPPPQPDVPNDPLGYTDDQQAEPGPAG